MSRILFLCSVAPNKNFYYMNDWCQHQSLERAQRSNQILYWKQKKKCCYFLHDHHVLATSRPNFEKRKIIGKGMMPIRKWMNNTLLLMLRHSFIDGTTPLWPSIPHHLCQGTSYTYPALMLLRPDILKSLRGTS